MEIPDRPLDPAYRITPFADASDVTADHVLALWDRERAVVGEEARRRVQQMHLVATVAATGELIGVSTAVLGRSRQLGLDLWYYRVFVSAAHRRSNVAVQLLDRGRIRLEETFTSGRDTRGAGVWIDVQNEAVARAQPQAVWPQTQYSFVGTNERGDHVRVRYFPGARLPESTR